MSGVAPIDDLHGLRATRLGGVAAPARLRLASRSPRRAELLSRHGFSFDPVDSGIDDSLLVRGAVTPAQWVAALAHLKACGGLETLRTAEPHANAFVLGADTVVVKDDRVIGQPRDAEDAHAIVRLLERGSHEVLTGVALLGTDGARLLFVDGARVRVGAIGEDRVAAYIASGQWRGKAGAYNLEERLRDAWPIEFEGDPGTVMGLPMVRLAPVLRRLLGEARPQAERSAP